eukprot:jgi/Chlat1/8364/Chrsp80S07796
MQGGGRGARRRAAVVAVQEKVVAAVDDGDEQAVQFLYDSTVALGNGAGDDDEAGILRPSGLPVDGDDDDSDEAAAGVANTFQDEDEDEDEFLALPSSPVAGLVATPVKELSPEPDYHLSSGGLRAGAPPWRCTDTRGIRSPLLCLHQDIVDLNRFMKPSEDEAAAREAAVDRVRTVVTNIWPSAKLEVHGSYATGLYLPTSDIDVVILNSACVTPVDGLRALGNALARRNMVKNLQVIAKAKVPIVKFTELPSNIAFDVSFDMLNGAEAVGFVKQMVEQMPALKPLCLVLKLFLQQRELNEVYSGGIGSYALIIMLIAHLQLVSSRRKLQRLDGNLGMLLLEFFQLYGVSLNIYSVGVSCRKGGAFFRKHDRDMVNADRPHLLAVEDPQDPTNDVGRNSYNVFKVRSAFEFAHQQLMAPSESAPFGLERILHSDKLLRDRASKLQWGIALDAVRAEVEDGEWGAAEPEALLPAYQPRGSGKPSSSKRDKSMASEDNGHSSKSKRRRRGEEEERVSKHHSKRHHSNSSPRNRRQRTPSPEPYTKSKRRRR